MTNLEKTIRRRTVNPIRAVRRRVIVMLMPGDVLGFREEKRRQIYTLPIENAFMIALTMFANQEKMRKRAERSAKRR